jgi:hypothetical protein
MWATLADTAPTTRPAYVIVNIDSGPGTTLDSNYVAAITNAEAAGWTMLGYVDTAEASASVSSVESQVETWRSLYGVQDIFLDDVTGAAANLSYYETLTGYVHSLGGSDVLNPGAPPASGYLSTNVCNGIVVMEDTLAAFESNPPPNYWGRARRTCSRRSKPSSRAAATWSTSQTREIPTATYPAISRPRTPTSSKDQGEAGL